MLKFETLLAQDVDGVPGPWMSRARVPGGWFVAARFSENSDAITFYPDPAHEWDGGSIDRDPWACVQCGVNLRGSQSYCLTHDGERVCVTGCLEAWRTERQGADGGD